MQREKNRSIWRKTLGIRLRSENLSHVRSPGFNLGDHYANLRCNIVACISFSSFNFHDHTNKWKKRALLPSCPRYLVILKISKITGLGISLICSRIILNVRPAGSSPWPDYKGAQKKKKQFTRVSPCFIRVSPAQATPVQSMFYNMPFSIAFNRNLIFLNLLLKRLILQSSSLTLVFQWPKIAIKF